MQLLFIINILSIIFLHVLSENTSNFTKIMSERNCPPNMFLVPIDDDSTKLICDCSINMNLYYSEKNACYQAYKQGPCPPEHYLVIPKGEILAKCEKNPCIEDGLVPFYGKCAPLFEIGPPCSPISRLTIDPENFEIVCSSRSLNIVTAPEKKCPPGSRRISLGACKRVFP